MTDKLPDRPRSAESTGTHLLIIGGSDPGISAALRAREGDAQARISVVLGDE